MAGKNEQHDETAGWDRVGRFLEDVGSLTEGIWRRNLALWSDVSQHLHTEGYTADVMTTDAKRAMATALENADDIWSFWTRKRDRERVAAGLPTVFLFFPRRDDAPTRHIPPDPVWIRGPFKQLEDLPEQAEIGLNGPSDDGILALRRCLVARLQPERGYLLEPHDVKGLVPGVYHGAVYLAEPPCPLATLQVIVQEAAPGPPD